MRTLGKDALLGIGLALVLTAAAGAGNLAKLPADHALPQSPDSPGVVTFSHKTHVEADKPACTACHPALFRMLEKGSPVQGGPRILHKEMEAGRQCGACHDGKRAHGLEDCAACHVEK
jgi:c(7)-type cytochrome triheme protein